MADIEIGTQAALHLQDKLGATSLLEAKKASDAEHEESTWAALKRNRKAVLWSLMVSMSVVMEGYDTILISNFIGYPSFAKKYGNYYGPDRGYLISTPWQQGISMGSTVGAIFGGIMNGQLCTRFGYRKVMCISLVFMAAFIFITFFANSLAVLLVGQILCGFSWGVFATVGPSYASEVCPTNLRAYLTTYVNLCWAIGQLIAAGVMESLINRPDQWSYRIPFAIQWLWPLPLTIGCYLMPESPWYLVGRDRIEEAKQSLRRLTSDRTNDELNGQLAMILHTIKMESEVTAGTSYLECFKGSDLRRTEIACLAFAGQILSGSTFAYVPTYFFENAGLSPDDAYKLNLGTTSIAFVGTILSWWLIAYIGRRSIYLGGQVITLVLLLLIGIVSVSSHTKGALWAQSALCILWVLCYAMTLGPIAYSFIAEISSARLRPLTVCLARTFYQIVNIFSQVVEPQFMNPTALNAKGKTAFFWAGTGVLMLVWAYFRLPEPNGRTYEELDILFRRGVSARKFTIEKVDAYEEVNNLTKMEEVVEHQEDATQIKSG
ncbi:MFS transporter, SP family, general alpha glucoside:H+ symporter [Sporothrix schenckii 1099-18]|uniref:MFS transporter, SP family, general alpha glucoside:H+ symporter n=1 Tax=Sporothrix schenckii 1099-18 TaxID=1397361 RepID=A0A0F2MB60_SPOSC|nr:MFS transporter, SP family, general alpha glucoside:H+ symporter [Sporothrix schenckii 1099-18]KJR86045.1 MFS transporter, SP family, general alpha glucoside:H+ symporter [Sporothrix schenckii 1099-18]